MAQLKDLIVNGATKFNGSVESDQPFKGNLIGNASSANILNAVLSANVTGDNKYYYIGSFACESNKSTSFHSKIAVYDKNTDTSRAELELHFKHSADNTWKVKNLFVTSSNKAEKFHLIEISGTEIQLWVQIETPEKCQIEVVTIYGDALTFTKTPSEVYDALPVGIDTLGIYDSPQHTAFGICDTASNISSKIITVADPYWDMAIGSILTVRFDNTNTAENPTFNVNNTGAVPVIYDSSNITLENLSYAGYAERYITYVYTGYSFIFIGWSVDNNTTYDEATTSKAGLLSAEDKAKLDTISKDADAVSFEKILTEGTRIGTLTINGTKIELYAPTNVDTTYEVMTGATKDADGVAGLVPAPTAGSNNAYLRGDGKWVVPPDTKYENATSSKSGLMSATDKAKLDDINIMTGATSGEEGAAGLVPKPEASDVHKFLKADGTWADPASIIKKSVIPSEATTEVDIPTEVGSSNNMIVYYNGILMEENVNYYISDSKLISIDFAFNKDSIVTFVGSNVDGSLNINTPADQVTLANGDSKFDGNNSVQTGMEWLSEQLIELRELKESQNIIKKSVIPSEATTEVDIPSEFDSYNNIIVYYNGILMEENVNYYISDSKLISIGFAFTKDSIVTFVGSAIDKSLNINNAADQVTLANGDSKFDGNNSVQTGMEWLSEQILALQSNKETQSILILKSTDWIEKSQTLEVVGVTETNTVIICPITSDQDVYTNYGVSCVAQGDGTLTFECDELPEVDIRINVVIL